MPLHAPRSRVVQLHGQRIGTGYASQRWDCAAEHHAASLEPAVTAAAVTLYPQDSRLVPGQAQSGTRSGSTARKPSSAFAPPRGWRGPTSASVSTFLKVSGCRCRARSALY